MGDEASLLEKAESLLPGRLHAGRETHAPWVWVNGDFVCSEALRLHYFSHVLHYGSGVFEGIRCYDTPAGPAVFRLRDHMERLLASARVYGLNVARTAADLQAATLETVRRNGARNGYIRPLVFFGEGPIHLTPSSRCPTEVFIAVRSLGTYLGEEGLRGGVKVILSSWRKFDRAMLPPTVKGCGHYTNSILAAQEAAAKGAVEAILLNADGSVAEATGENVFFVKNGLLTTNGDSSNILPGITRDSVLGLATDLGIPAVVRPFGPEDLLGADEVFLTGTAAEVTPVAAIDGHPIRCSGDGVTARLQKAYFDTVRGLGARSTQWLSHA